MSDLMHRDFLGPGELYNQIYQEEVNREHVFNMMLIGLSGVGKSSLVKSLFQGLMVPKSDADGPVLNEYSDIIEEGGVRLRLRCVETSGYEHHNIEEWRRYVDKQLETYFVSQRRHAKGSINDTRIHVCLYLIPAYIRVPLSKEDIECMKALHERVHLVPLISMADTVAASKLSKFKDNLTEQLKANDINYYKFYFDAREDEERSKRVKKEADRYPFATVSADEARFENGNLRWILSTGAGDVDIWDNTKFDFDALAKLLVRHCMLNLIDDTHITHYAKFKSEVLAEATNTNCRSLRDMGLEYREVRRIKKEMNAIGTNGDC